MSKTKSALKITQNEDNHAWYATWRDNTGELRFVIASSRLRALSLATFCLLK